MRPDASRREVVRSLRSLAHLIHENLPRRVDTRRAFLTWDATAPLLLARIARQGETLALLIEHGHELDAEMVMRSLLEHLVLFAWLAIDVDDTARPGVARNPAENTQWWMIDQFRREKASTQHQMQHLPGFDTPEMRRNIRQATNYVKTLPTRRPFPGVLQQAEEVDAYWAPRLDGWYSAAPGDDGFIFTFQGHYWTLYSKANSSVHPDWGSIRRFVKPPSASGYQRDYIVRETPDDVVNVFVSITAFLLGDAIAVADAALGWDAYDQALRLLDRWDEVRAPNLLLHGARLTLGRRRRWYGRAENQLLRLELTNQEFSVAVVKPDKSWWRLRHPLGGRHWHLDEASGMVQDLNPGTGFELGPAVMEVVALLADAAELRRKPSTWPVDLP